MAGVSCLVGLGYQPLSWDEAVTASAASRSLPALWRLVNHTDAPLGAYYLAMHGWLRLLSAVDLRPTEGWLRLPSALAGVAAVALTAGLAARLFTPLVGLAAGLLLAVHPLVVFYAHDARPYTLVTVGVLLSVLALRRALRRPTAGSLIVYAASCVLVLYAHLFALFALAAQAGVILWKGTRRGRFAVVAAVVALTAAPLGWLASHQSGEIGWVARPDLTGVASFLLRIAGVPVAIAVALLAVPLARSAYRRRRAPAPGAPASGAPVGVGASGVPAGVVPDSRGALLVGWALLPPVTLVVVSFVQPVLVARYALVAVPAVVIVVALLLRRVGGRFAVGIAIAAVLAAGTITVVQQAQPYKYEDFRAAADTVADSARPGDGLVFLPASFRVGYDNYLRPDRSDPAVPVAADVALLAPARWRGEAVIGGQECPPEVLTQRIGAHDRIFLVGSTLAAAVHERHSPAEIAKEHILLAQYTQVWSTHHGAVTVTLLLRRPHPLPLPLPLPPAPSAPPPPPTRDLGVVVTEYSGLYETRLPQLQDRAGGGGAWGAG